MSDRNEQFSDKSEQKQPVEKLYSFEDELGFALPEEDKAQIEQLWKEWTKSQRRLAFLYSTCFIARSPEEIAGRHPIVGIMTLSRDTGDKSKGLLANLFVEKKHRGKGIAQKLFKDAIRHAKAHGLTELIAERDNVLTSDAARHIHDKKIGFDVLPEEDGEKSGGTGGRERIRLDLSKYPSS